MERYLSLLGVVLLGCGANAADAAGTAGAATNMAGSPAALAGNTASGGSGGTTALGGSASGGSSASAGSNTAGGSGARSQTCRQAVKSALPSTAPALEVGVWKNITPATHLGFIGAPETMIAQGIAMDPCDTATLYWGTTPYEADKGGLFKSSDGGGSWTKVGPFDEPLHVRIDPTDPQHLYVTR